LILNTIRVRKNAGLYEKRFNAVRALTFYYETFGRRNTDEMTRRAVRVQNGAIINGKEGKPKTYYVEFKNNADEWDYDTDREILAALLKNYREQVEIKYQPDFYNVIDHDFKGNYQKFVDHLYKKSKLMKSDKKIYVNKGGYHKDPGVVYGQSLVSALADINLDLENTIDSIAVQERYLCAAKLRMEEDMPNYSDANFTMRLSYGQVGEYLLAGQPSGYYTEASSIVKKMEKGENGIIDYEAEPIMKELLSKKDFGKYTDKNTGKLQLCFLTNNDITGGNSGSPMFNGKGELIGLAFDGNWDSLSSDIFFDKQLARCIGVDIRYVLYMMESWGKADRLLKEINAQ
jgi:Peptidase S46.